MKRTLLLCTAIFLCFFLSETKAQTDTTKYDLGRLQMDKKLTQTITIKAADLEKLPFSTLTDAINVWLYGVYGAHQSYVFVIDGVVMTDVNALSIYDIDEITLVQNAAAVLNGASPQQFLLLIKTRRNRPGKYGFDVTGQTNLVKPYINQNTTGKNSSRGYNQYYLSGYVNTGNIHAGLSADFQRDAIPLTQQLSATGYNNSTEDLNRYKLNAYLDASLGASSILSISAGYVPQNGDGSVNAYSLSSSGSTTSTAMNTIKENLYYNNISLKSAFSGFTNTLTGAFQHVTSNNGINTFQVTTVGGNYTITQNHSITNTADNLLFKDNLAYTIKSGNWKIEPNLNIMYRHYKTTGNQINNYAYYAGSAPFADSTATSSNNLIIKQSLLTPAININYRNVLMLQGGFEVMLSTPISNTYGFKPKRTYPFASVMLNVIDKEKHTNGLSIFGSFANTNSYMGDINNYVAYISTVNSQFVSTTYYMPSTTGLVNLYNNFNQLQAGANFSLIHEKLLLTYNFSNQKFDGSNDTYHYYYAGKLYVHRLGFDMNWVKTDKFNWETNLNVSFIKGILNYNAPAEITHHLTTGGFINRLNYKKAFLGADVLYLLQDNASYSYTSVVDKNHGVSLQNLYAGLKIAIKGIKSSEVYVNARNLIESKGANIQVLDTRKYYGLGFKLGL